MFHKSLFDIQQQFRSEGACCTTGALPCIGMGDDHLAKLEMELNYAALNSLITLTIFELQRSLELGAIIAKINIFAANRESERVWPTLIACRI